MRPPAEVLRRAAERLAPRREALLEAWLVALERDGRVSEGDLRSSCSDALDQLLDRLAEEELEPFQQTEAETALETVRAGGSLLASARSIRLLGRCFQPLLTQSGDDPQEVEECLATLDDLGLSRLELLLEVQENEMARRLIEAQELAAEAQESARRLRRLNTDLRRAQAQSRHRADQIALFNDVTRRLAALLEPERLLQTAADTIQARLNHTYVAVVVLDDDGVLVGRWAGRPGVGRRSSGRAQGPAGGVIGRALRKRAPQVVADVERDPEYHPDVPGTRSEMVVPLLDAGAAVGAIDFQSERSNAFDLDDVAAGEAVGEFLVVALRNARLFDEARRARSEQ